MRKKIRKWLIIACIAIVLFVPTYIALISYAVINAMPEPVDASKYDISVISPTGKKIKIDDTDAEQIKELFLIMRRDASPMKEFSESGGYRYSVTLSGEDSGTYEFIFLSDARGYMLVGETAYKLKAKEVKKFISSKYAYDMYENSKMPSLISGDDRNILPQTAVWKYLSYGGATVEAPVDIRAKTVTYDHSGTLDLSFTAEPDVCNIIVSSSLETLYSGTLAGYRAAVIDETVTLEYSIYAKWTDTECRGEANYHFYAVIGKPAEFELNEAKFEGKYLEFAEIIASNVGIVEDALLIVSPSVGCEPKFFADGAHARVVIPFGNDTPEGKYKIVAIYGDTTEEFEIDYVKRPLSDSENSLPPEDTETVEANRNAYIDLIKEVCAENVQTVYISGKFIDPEDKTSAYGANCSLLVGFGRVRHIGDSNVGYKNDGVVYRTHGTVYAINGGKVVKTGEDNWLGKYVVVDHGLGIKTWYCNLLSVDVGEGETVKKSQAVGMAGNSGYTDKDSFGFYLMTTVNGVPISPYMLFEQGLKMSATVG